MQFLFIDFEQVSAPAGVGRGWDQSMRTGLYQKLRAEEGIIERLGIDAIVSAIPRKKT